MEITDIRHDWPEKAGFTLVRPTGIEIYTFLHFMNSVEIEINREKVTVRPGACIFYAPDEPQWFHSDSNLTHNWAHFACSFCAIVFQKTHCFIHVRQSLSPAFSEKRKLHFSLMNRFGRTCWKHTPQNFLCVSPAP